MLVLGRARGQKIICRRGNDQLTITCDGFNATTKHLQLSIANDSFFISAMLRLEDWIEVPMCSGLCLRRERSADKGIRIQFVGFANNQHPRIGIDADDHVSILRDEVKSNRAAAPGSPMVAMDSASREGAAVRSDDQQSADAREAVAS